MGLYVGNQKVSPTTRVGTVVWGNIGGTLSNQTDLQDAIDKKETVQNITILDSGTIELSQDSSIYKHSPSDTTTYTFDTTNLNLVSGEAYTFELCITLNTTQTLVFPSNLAWQDDEIPDLSLEGMYFLVFRTIDGGTSWLGNLQGIWIPYQAS